MCRSVLEELVVGLEEPDVLGLRLCVEELLDIDVDRFEGLDVNLVLAGCIFEDGGERAVRGSLRYGTSSCWAGHRGDPGPRRVAASRQGPPS